MMAWIMNLDFAASGSGSAPAATTAQPGGYINIIGVGCWVVATWITFQFFQPY